MTNRTGNINIMKIPNDFVTPKELNNFTQYFLHITEDRIEDPICINMRSIARLLKMLSVKYITQTQEDPLMEYTALNKKLENKIEFETKQLINMCQGTEFVHIPPNILKRFARYIVEQKLILLSHQRDENGKYTTKFEQNYLNND